MKLLRTVRFDASDSSVFARGAAPDEWAVSGAFAFAHLPAEALTGKTRQAFANGFLSLDSFGRSTFVTVAAIDRRERDAAVEALAAHLVAEYGAPDLAAARPAAEDEVAFAEELCRGAPINTVFTVRRTLRPDGGIGEEFRIVTPPSEPLHTRIWDVVHDDR